MTERQTGGCGCKDGEEVAQPEGPINTYGDLARFGWTRFSGHVDRGLSVKEAARAAAADVLVWVRPILVDLLDELVEEARS
jgi:hypothetical protein